eukprot:CAMPEP_0195538722 /NCGR_PEP_ID=MMETSP0794_2-20130614/49684_1 /TAXON_ID=515487 /ORGANISM="Stephanopyxis turris, Strain CCMP 815" /LENGTH=229 /DNA_ID=CAMNT_0040672729 /DNA_START=42 /DNA_END=731 /DNA_ORIENTATION=-
MVFSTKSSAATGLLVVVLGGSALSCFAFAPSGTGVLLNQQQSCSSSSSLQMGLFDNFRAGGSGDLDEEWEKQQEILKMRRAPQAEREKYFSSVEERRVKASKEQKDKWAWQTKKYRKGEDPIDEWKKRRANGQISDLENQYGDPDKIGGIPLPSASFGVGGEFGVGGKFDNGGRFDLRLPYADQGYVDEDSDVMGKIGNFFSGGKKKEPEPEPEVVKETPKKNKWPWEK